MSNHRKQGKSQPGEKRGNFLIEISERLEKIQLDSQLLHHGKNSPSFSRGTIFQSPQITKPRPSQQPSKTPQMKTRDSPSLLSYPRSSNGTPVSLTQSSKTLPKKPKKEPIRNSLGSLVTQVSSKAKPGINKSEVLYREHLFQTFESVKFCRFLPSLDPSVLNQKKVSLPRRKGYETSKTIVFDLDETLVHCVEDPSQGCDVLLPIFFPTGESINAGINIRPYARECLREANKHFEVIVFTASHQCYADVVLNYLDPTGDLIHHRLYRDNCVIVEGVFMKDLRILTGRSLQNTVIVDNAPYSFGYQLDNGIPIISWHEDKADRELYNLIDYMKVLAYSHDIRNINRQTFKLHSFYEDYMQEFMSESKNPVRKTIGARSPRQKVVKRNYKELLEIE